MLTLDPQRARTDSARFWDSNAPLASLQNLLIEDVIESLGDAVPTQLDGASECGTMFVGFGPRSARARQGPGIREAVRNLQYK
jgi:hypothetical protein